MLLGMAVAIVMVVGLVWNLITDGFEQDSKPEPHRSALPDDVLSHTVDEASLGGIVRLKEGEQMMVNVGTVNDSARIYRTVAYHPHPAVAKVEMMTLPAPGRNPGDDTGYNILVINARGFGEGIVRYGVCPIEFQKGGTECLNAVGEPIWGPGTQDHRRMSAQLHSSVRQESSTEVLKLRAKPLR